MNKNKMKWLFSLIMVCILMISGCGGSSPGPSASSSEKNESKKEVRKLKVVSFLATNNQLMKEIVPMWMKKVEKETNGELQFEWIGGPESIPTKDQFDAVVNGIVDVGFNATSFFPSQYKEASAYLLSEYTPMEERNNGFYEYFVKRSEAQGVTYLGRWLGNTPFYFWSNKEISSLSELKGLKFRSVPTYHDIMLKLGMNPINVDPADVYTALDRKMVDGFAFTLAGPRDSGWTEVTKFIINAPFLSSNGTIFINPKVYKSLSPEIQKKLISITADFEKEMMDYYAKMNEKEWGELKKAGVKTIELKADEKQRFLNLVRETKWANLEKVVPELIPDLKKFTIKP